MRMRIPSNVHKYAHAWITILLGLSMSVAEAFYHCMTPKIPFVAASDASTTHAWEDREVQASELLTVRMHITNWYAGPCVTVHTIVLVSLTCSHFQALVQQLAAKSPHCFFTLL